MAFSSLVVVAGTAADLPLMLAQPTGEAYPAAGSAHGPFRVNILASPRR
jgi:hypothetical protein